MLGFSEQTRASVDRPLPKVGITRHARKRNRDSAELAKSLLWIGLEMDDQYIMPLT
jgi:hypothetical protein